MDGLPAMIDDGPSLPRGATQSINAGDWPAPAMGVGLFVATLRACAIPRARPLPLRLHCDRRAARAISGAPAGSG